MEIQISEKFAGIKAVIASKDSITIQCPLWPSWSALHEACKDTLNLWELQDLQDLFTAETQSREFVTEDEVLKIRLAESVSI
jgi:hypothetical protein